MNPSTGKNLKRQFPASLILTNDVSVMMPLSNILRKNPGRYKFTKAEEKINQFMCIDDIKIFYFDEK